MPEPGRRLALLIGLSQYKHLRALAGPQHDVNELAATLKAHSDFSCEIAEHTGYADIREQIYRFIRQLEPVDTGLLYYSGHGVPGGDGSVYLSTYDTALEDPSEKGFSEEEVRRFCRTSKARAFVAIIDCCYAGVFTESGKGDPICGTF